MSHPWSEDELARIDAAEELRIATRRPDGTWRPEVPIWAVRTDGRVYVRTWHRRETGWYGHAVASGRARVSVPGLEREVVVDDVGDSDRAAVDAAYRAKYDRLGGGVERMVGAKAVATTLRLRPCD